MISALSQIYVWGETRESRWGFDLTNFIFWSAVGAVGLAAFAVVRRRR